MSDEAQCFPIWAKFWIYSELIKLKPLDKNSGTFRRRSKSTVSPFPQFSKRSVVKVLEDIVSSVEDSEQSISSQSDLLQKNLFGELYAKTLNELEQQDAENSSVSGNWKKYPKGSDPSVLQNDLFGKNTGWCTEYDPKAAPIQLENGDFHVFLQRMNLESALSPD